MEKIPKLSIKEMILTVTLFFIVSSIIFIASRYTFFFNIVVVNPSLPMFSLSFKSNTGLAFTYPFQISSFPMLLIVLITIFPSCIIGIAILSIIIGIIARVTGIDLEVAYGRDRDILSRGLLFIGLGIGIFISIHVIFNIGFLFWIIPTFVSEWYFILGLLGFGILSYIIFAGISLIIGSISLEISKLLLK